MIRVDHTHFTDGQLKGWTPTEYMNKANARYQSMCLAVGIVTNNGPYAEPEHPSWQKYATAYGMVMAQLHERYHKAYRWLWGRDMGTLRQSRLDGWSRLELALELRYIEDEAAACAEALN